ncbi:Uncharacterized protein Adt_41978 [Abeliophyllum distichum]|uniref:Uncharacterized protein n=1 Tax=Abeliophyllum distichum TaxID=126358 RepID=A0ABD1PQE8_9LAMI
MQLIQDKDKLLKDFISWFNRATLGIKNLQMSAVVTAMMSGTRSRPFKMSLSKNLPDTMHELLKRGDKYVDAEKAYLITKTGEDTGGKKSRHYFAGLHHYRRRARRRRKIFIISPFSLHTTEDLMMPPLEYPLFGPPYPAPYLPPTPFPHPLPNLGTLNPPPGPKIPPIPIINIR